MEGKLIHRCMRRQTKRFSFRVNLLLACFAAAQVTCYVPAQIGIGEPITIPVAGTRIYPAEPGVTSDILGLGFEQTFANTDAGGASHRVYPAKIAEAAYHEYEADFDLIDDQLDLDAYGRFLFVKAKVAVTTNHRYMVVHARQINRVASLAIDGPRIGDVPMFASKIYYGWALYVVIEGDSTTFSGGVAVELGRLVKLRLGLEGEIAKHHLTSHVVLVGLTPKQVDSIPIATSPEAIQASFMPTAPDEPIAVEYTLARDMSIGRIPWEKHEFRPGGYVLSADIAIASRDADGDDWEPGGAAPKLATYLYIDGQYVTTCTEPERFTATDCFAGKLIEVNENTAISLEVRIKHENRGDVLVGKAGPLRVMGGGGQPGAPIPLGCRSAHVTLP